MFFSLKMLDQLLGVRFNIEKVGLTKVGRGSFNWGLVDTMASACKLQVGPNLSNRPATERQKGLI